MGSGATKKPRPRKKLHQLELRQHIAQMDASAWFEFLEKEYFFWKYTAATFYARNIKHLQCYKPDSLDELDRIRQRLLKLSMDDILTALETAAEILGLGIAGASGLLALMYPRHFGTVDQFAVKALRKVKDLPQAHELQKMNPMSLKLQDGAVLIKIFRDKAEANNRVLKSNAWTPRLIDMVLWTYGRSGDPASSQQEADLPEDLIRQINDWARLKGISRSEAIIPLLRLA